MASIGSHACLSSSSPASPSVFVVEVAHILRLGLLRRGVLLQSVCGLGQALVRRSPDLGTREDDVVELLAVTGVLRSVALSRHRQGLCPTLDLRGQLAGALGGRCADTAAIVPSAPVLARPL